MGNFEKLSVLVIVVIIVMILVVALYTWTDNTDGSTAGTTDTSAVSTTVVRNDPPPSTTAFPPAPPTDRARLPMIGAGGTAATTTTNSAGTATAPGTGTNPMTGSTTPDAGAIPPATTGEPARTEPTEARVHVVASGDNLTKIAKQYFHSTGQRFIDAIARANPGIDPNRLRVNQKLQIPSEKDVPAATRGSSGGGTIAATVAPSSSGSAPKAGSVYTVRRGEKLQDIARRAYGSSENWHLIWLENFTTIRDPDEVPSGTKLKIPHVP